MKSRAHEGIFCFGWGPYVRVHGRDICRMNGLTVQGVHAMLNVFFQRQFKQMMSRVDEAYSVGAL